MTEELMEKAHFLRLEIKGLERDIFMCETLCKYKLKGISLSFAEVDYFPVPQEAIHLFNISIDNMLEFYRVKLKDKKTELQKL